MSFHEYYEEKRMLRKKTKKSIIYHNDKTITYISILPHELIEDLLLYIPYKELLDLRSSIFNRYITKTWWIYRLSIKTQLLKDVFMDIVLESDEKRAMKFIFVLNFLIGDDSFNGNMTDMYVSLCSHFLEWNYTSIIPILKREKRELRQWKPGGLLHFIRYLNRPQLDINVVKDCIDLKLIDPDYFLNYLDEKINMSSSYYTNDTMLKYYNNIKNKFLLTISEINMIEK